MKHHPLSLNLRQLSPFLILAIVFVLLLFVFQNCAEPLSEDDELSVVGLSAPFAFDVQADTLAYMSCSNMQPGYDRNTFFTFKAGAYNVGSGLKYTDKYISHTGGFDPERRSGVLTYSPINVGLKLQLAPRLNSNPVNLVLNGNVPNAYTYSYGNFEPELSSHSISINLPQSLGTSRTNYFGSDGYVEAKVDYLLGNGAQNIRNDLDGDSARLYLSFSQAGSNLAQDPGGSSSINIPGSNFRVAFSKASGSTGDLEAQMTQVTEYNPTNSTQTNWPCDQKYRFLIVRSSDLGSGLCTFAQGSAIADNPANDPTIVAELRKYLPAENWAIDTTKKCIAPKKPGSCYGSNAGTINYTGSCSLAANNCPHYLSVCKR